MASAGGVAHDCFCSPTFSAGALQRSSDAKRGDADGKGQEEDDVESLLQKLCDAEKVRVLSGRSFWQAGGVPRVGLPPLVMTDGPNGVRGFRNTGVDGAALAPCETAMAATFNEALIEQIGQLLGREAARLGAHVLLGPAVNLHRVPTSGRHFECFSEDPHLSARAAVAYIRGVQRHVAACVKHFAANDQENDRFYTSSVVEERALVETHLVPFEAAVREAGVEAVMTAYNRLNGTYCAESKWLLEQVLRKQWGFRGLCISDWFGNVSTVQAIEAGLNVEMPGVEPRHYGGWLRAAVRAGRVSRKLLDERCRPVLRLLRRRGRTELHRLAPETPEEHTERRELLRRAAAESLVLLRNEDAILPFNTDSIRSIAVIGPNAVETSLQGGGSSRVRPRRCQTISEALREALQPQGIEVLQEQGTTPEFLPNIFTDKTLQLMASTSGCDHAGQPGDLEGARRVDRFWDVATWFSQREWFRLTVMRVVRWYGIGLAPPPGPRPPSAPLRPWRRRGVVVAALLAAVLSWVRRARRSFQGWRSRRWILAAPGLLASLGLARWRRKAVLEDRRRREEEGYAHFVGYQEHLMERAQAAATAADACVVVLGTSGFWETEAGDQPHMKLPGRQDELLIRVLMHARGPVVVVLNTGSPKELSWLEHVPAVLLSHFGGEEMGPAVADALLGRLSPAGRLPTTWPRRLEEAPAVAAHLAAGGGQGGDERDVVYREGLRFGYRGFGEQGPAPPGATPLFPFGHGLSYAWFRYGSLEVEQLAACSEEMGPRAMVHVEVENVGEIASAEVAQLYATAGMEGLRALCGFGRSLVLAPGESARFHFELDERALGRSYDAEASAWRPPQPGSSVWLEVGASSVDVRATATLVLE